MRWDEYPPALRAVRVVGTIPASLILLGLGIAYVVMGNTAGRLVGVVMLLVWVALVAFAARRHFGKPG